MSTLFRYYISGVFKLCILMQVFPWCTNVDSFQTAWSSEPYTHMENTWDFWAVCVCVWFFFPPLGHFHHSVPPKGMCWDIPPQELGMQGEKNERDTDKALFGVMSSWTTSMTTCWSCVGKGEKIRCFKCPYECFFGSKSCCFDWLLLLGACHRFDSCSRCPHPGCQFTSLQNSWLLRILDCTLRAIILNALYSNETC